jgi:hypothetical protein
VNHLLYIPTHRNIKQLSSRGQVFIVNTLTWGVKQGMVTGRSRPSSCVYDSDIKKLFVTIENGENGPGPALGELMDDGSVTIMNNGSGPYSLFNTSPPSLIAYSSNTHIFIHLLLNFVTGQPTLLYYNMMDNTAPVVMATIINSTAPGIWTPNSIFLDPPDAILFHPR